MIVMQIEIVAVGACALPRNVSSHPPRLSRQLVADLDKHIDAAVCLLSHLHTVKPTCSPALSTSSPSHALSPVSRPQLSKTPRRVWVKQPVPRCRKRQGGLLAQWSLMSLRLQLNQPSTPELWHALGRRLRCSVIALANFADIRRSLAAAGNYRHSKLLDF